MSESPVNKIVGWLLIVVGGLWVLLTGGCTLAFLQSVFLQHSGSNAASGALPFLVIGAFCIAPGAAVLWLGVHMVRRNKRSGVA